MNTFNIIAFILFIAASLWLLYVFVMYPIIMAVWGRVRGKMLKTVPMQSLPDVAIIMAAYNEEQHIAAKLQNYIDLDYPRDKLAFYIGSDNSSDRTDDIIREYQKKDSTIHLRRFNRCGKTEIVYTFAAQARQQIHVFTDTDALLNPDAIRVIVDCFSDPSVGCVNGRMNYHDNRGDIGSQGERKYLKIEDVLRRNEALVWTTISPTGPCVAARVGCYTPIADYRLSDDLNLSITTSLNGYRSWYEPRLVIHEKNIRTLWSEASRRLRMGRQSYVTYRWFSQLRAPWKSYTAFQTWSHKLMRNVSGIPAMIFAFSAVYLAWYAPVFMWISLLLAAFIVLSVIGVILDKFRISFPLFRYPLYFVVMTGCLTIGSVRGMFLGGLEKWSSPRLNKS